MIFDNASNIIYYSNDTGVNASAFRDTGVNCLTAAKNKPTILYVYYFFL